MNAREQARFDMIKRVGTFGTNNASEFISPVPPALAVTPGQTQAKQRFNRSAAAIADNFYRTNAAKLGEWHTASHVERQAKKKKRKLRHPESRSSNTRFP